MRIQPASFAFTLLLGLLASVPYSGIDISLPVAIGMAAVLYLVLLFAFPEPRYVFGPEGARLVPARDAEIPAVIEDPKASAHRQVLRNRSEALREAELTKDETHA